MLKKHREIYFGKFLQAKENHKLHVTQHFNQLVVQDCNQKRKKDFCFILDIIVPSKGILMPAILELKAQSRTSDKLSANLITPYWSVKKTEIRRTCGLAFFSWNPQGTENLQESESESRDFVFNNSSSTQNSSRK